MNKLFRAYSFLSQGNFTNRFQQEEHLIFFKQLFSSIGSPYCSQTKYRSRRTEKKARENKKTQKSPVTCEIAIKSEMNSTDGEIVVRQGL